jgi:DNA adenine methylase
MFNVPFGRYKHPRILNEANLFAASWALQDTGATIFEADYQKATEKSGEGDFIYFDPPYDPISKTSGFTDYTAVGFDKEDQLKLAEWFGELASRGCIVVLSNSDTALVRRLYRRYFMKSIEVNRPINCKGKGRTGFKELVISNDPSNRQV